MQLVAALREGTTMAGNALLKNKLRSFLSVLGITIGIYCIIAVYALVHSMEKNLNDSFSGFGTDVLFVQKWPWDDIGGEYPWWKYMGRPQPNTMEADFVAENLPSNLHAGVAFTFNMSTGASYKSVSLDFVRVNAISYSYNQIQKVDIEYGRYFSLAEMQAGRPVAILGAGIATELFGTLSPLGKQIRLKGQQATVIGVCKKEGKSVINNSPDEQIFIPVNFAAGLTNMRKGEKNCQIMVKAANGVSLDDLSFEIEQLMRRNRRIKPHEDPSFAINRMSMITNIISKLFAQIGLIGFVIGGFSMLVGCFGVANIMFVSVKERTQEIGIQKSLGAKKSFILTQFLIESIMLCLLGGLVGLFFVWLTLTGMNAVLSGQMDSALKLYLSSTDIGIGLGVSIAVGILAGVVPAASAAKLDPVEAIRSK